MTEEADGSITPTHHVRAAMSAISRHRLPAGVIGCGVGLTCAGVMLGQSALRGTGMTMVIIGVILVAVADITQRLNQLERTQQPDQSAVEDAAGKLREELEAERVLRRARNSYERDGHRSGVHAAAGRPRLSVIRGAKGFLALPVLGLWGVKDATVASLTAAAVVSVPFALSPAVADPEVPAFAATVPRAAQVVPVVEIREVPPVEVVLDGADEDARADVRVRAGEVADVVYVSDPVATVRGSESDETPGEQPGSGLPADSDDAAEPHDPDDDYELDDYEPGGLPEPVKDVVIEILDTTDDVVDGLLGALR